MILAVLIPLLLPFSSLLLLLLLHKIADTFTSIITAVALTTDSFTTSTFSTDTFTSDTLL